MSDQSKSSLDASEGSLGSAFNQDGSVGGMAQKIGGPFDSKGAVGKEFTTEGSVGGAAQSTAEQLQGDKKPLFDKEGAIGKAFTPEGAVGGIGEKIGGPFASTGAIGKQFDAEQGGAIGGTVQSKLGDDKQ